MPVPTYLTDSRDGDLGPLYDDPEVAWWWQRFSELADKMNVLPPDVPKRVLDLLRAARQVEVEPDGIHWHLGMLWPDYG